jgi:hypothetical protein
MMKNKVVPVNAATNKLREIHWEKPQAGGRYPLTFRPSSRMVMKLSTGM